MDHTTLYAVEDTMPSRADDDGACSSLFKANPLMNRRTLLGSAAVLGGLCLADAVMGGELCGLRKRYFCC